MGSYIHGSAVTLAAEFTLPDGTPADPTTVTYRLRVPESSTVLSFVYGVAAEVVKVDVGVYECRLTPASMPVPGAYFYDAVGTGAVVAILEGDFYLIPSNVVPVAAVGPVLGPCAPWIGAEDVAAFCSACDFGNPEIFADVAVEASMALYEISGRQFTGLCTQKVRPSRDPCGCWGGPASLGIGPWYWSQAFPGAGGWGWRNECGDRGGCSPMSKVRLAGYPVVDIVEVKIDGTVLDPLDANGHPNYRLDRWTELIRMDDPGPPQQERFWPSCQNLSLDDTEPGTFSVTYRSGVQAPELGRRAAAELACQLFMSVNPDGECMLPAGVTRVVRQGIEIDRQLLANWFDPTKSTGIVSLDLFLRSYWQARSGRRPAVFSPDLQQYARPSGV